MIFKTKWFNGILFYNDIVTWQWFINTSSPSELKIVDSDYRYPQVNWHLFAVLYKLIDFYHSPETVVNFDGKAE